MVDNDATRMPRRGKAGDDPKMIGLWKVGRTIGKGSSGRVRIARHIKTGQFAAVKIVSKNALLNSRMSLKSLGEEADRILHSIEREIVIMKLIEHPNIMRLYDVWETSSELYLILEYVEGGELFDYLCNKGRLSSSEALGYFQQIITAVHYCHRFNIAHRDLKPENLLLDRDKNIKVADFGMAAWQGKNNMLQTACGSPHYAAPEVIMGRAYNGSSSDIWSCGIILFALLAGRLPFDDEDLPTLLEKVKVGRYTMPTDIDPRAKDLIRKMLTKDPAKRITIPEILRHPFYTSQKPKKMNCDIPNLDEIARPLANASDIDPDIFANLRTLWHGTPDSDIVTSLTNDKHTWEKGVYHLLVRYRANHLENYDEEEEQILVARRSSKRRSNKTQTNEQADADSLPPRDGPPTPRRAARRNDMSSSPSPPQGIARMHSLAVLSSRNPSSTQITPTASLHLRPHPSSLVDTLPPVSPRITNSPMLQVPEVQDEKLQQFFHQIVEHLQVMQVTGETSQARPQADPARSPASLAAPPPTPDDMAPRPPCLLNVEHTSAASSTNSVKALSDASDRGRMTRPLSIRRRQGIDHEADKENVGQRPHLTVTTTFESDITPGRKSSLRSNSTPMMDRRVHILEPLESTRSRLKKKRSRIATPTSPVSAVSVVSDGSFALPSTPKRRWFGNLFKFRPTNYCLLSVRDPYRTQEACRRMLEGMGVSVALAHEPPEVAAAAGLGSFTLKCRLEEVRDGGIFSSVKGVKFRVEVHKPTPVQAAGGCITVLVLVLEKGAATSLKLVYSRLKRDWDLDVPPTPYHLTGPMALPDDERFVEVVYAHS